ncbi:RNA 2',3'-cyclic phosphodiesterase [Parasulfuritortus cantonensis]|uniref:RNA 2',3'-cyclic phosphodiesterase n=1 Tax=Parasulfuritortus cantonensis TaxID=2528202 RepID=A0A4R1BDI3_9PROT|nr:RNA 2',3'-cyclic phosphodiesterase [Parasulfuritortus cantonensis]TCJ15165.1 RNA 2',3'-cyclic phosphodiesterase [Parasulfuritortus cantonensis]
MPDRAGLTADGAVGATTARLFLALWPDAALRGQLAAQGRRLQQALGGRLTRPETIHLTLVFIGNLARTRLPELMAGLAGIEAAAVRMELDHAECWRHNHVAFVAPRRTPASLQELVGKLEAALTAAAIPFDRRPYRAHVTLVRRADCEKANPAQGRVSDTPEWGVFRPLTWSAGQFVLVESVPTPIGVRYDVLGSYVLL